MRNGTIRLLWLFALTYGVVLAAGSPAGFPRESPTGSRMPFLADKPLGEDGYYMLTVAWHVGTGRGLTYNTDGETTGVQPLATWIYGGLACVVRQAGGDRWTFARVILLAGVLQWLLLAAVVMRITRLLASGARHTVPDVAVPLSGMLVLLNYDVFRLSTYGLETPLYLLLFGLCVILSLHDLRSLRSALLFGVVAGCTALARIDFLIVLAVFAGVRVIRRQMSIASAAVIGITTAAIVSPWFAWVYSRTGHLIPSSGRAQAGAATGVADMLARAAEMSAAIAQHVTPWVYLQAAYAASASVTTSDARRGLIAALALGVGAFMARHGWRTQPSEVRSRLGAWAMALAALLAVYAGWFWAIMFAERYSAPLLLVVLPLIAIGLPRLVSPIRAMSVGRAVMLAAFALTAWITLHTGRLGNTHSLSAGYVNHALPPPALVGAFQSGVVGYYNENVVNLDGKVNAAALAAAEAGALQDYVDARGVTHLVDWRQALDGGLGDAYLAGWIPCRVPAPGRSVCLERPPR